MRRILITILLFALGAAVTTAQDYRSTEYKSQYDRLNEQYCSGMFRSTEGTILDLQENNSSLAYFNILDWLQGRVAGLQVYTTRNGTRIPLIRGRQAQLFLDEMPISAGLLGSIPVNDIAIVKVMRGQFPGSFGNNSAIAVYSIKIEEE